MPIDENHKNLKFIDIIKAKIPAEGITNNMKDRYWVVHPSKGIVFFNNRPQCNSNETIANGFLKSYPWAIIMFIESVFIPVYVHEWDYEV